MTGSEFIPDCSFRCHTLELLKPAYSLSYSNDIHWQKPHSDLQCSRINCTGGLLVCCWCNATVQLLLQTQKDWLQTSTGGIIIQHSNGSMSIISFFHHRGLTQIISSWERNQETDIDRTLILWKWISGNWYQKILLLRSRWVRGSLEKCTEVLLRDHWTTPSLVLPWGTPSMSQLLSSCWKVECTMWLFLSLPSFLPLSRSPFIFIYVSSSRLFLRNWAQGLLEWDWHTKDDCWGQ